MKTIFSSGLILASVLSLQANESTTVTFEDYRNCHAYACQIVEQVEMLEGDDVDAEAVYGMAYSSCKG